MTALAAIRPVRLVGMIDARHPLTPYLALAALNAMLVFVVGALMQGGFLSCLAFLIAGPVGALWMTAIGLVSAWKSASLALAPVGVWIAILLLLSRTGARDESSLRRLTAASACITGVQVLCSPLLLFGGAVAAVWSTIVVGVCIRVLRMSWWIVGACVAVLGVGTGALWQFVL